MSFGAVVLVSAQVLERESVEESVWVQVWVLAEV